MPQVDDTPVEELREKLAANLLPLLSSRAGVAQLIKQLPLVYTPESVAQQPPSTEFRAWELVGLHYLKLGRVHESLTVFTELYEQLYRAQLNGKRVHKGTALLWMYECYLAMGFSATAKRYLMLTLCEDAIGFQGNISAEESGLYFRIIWRHGLTDQRLREFAQQIYRLSIEHPTESLYPEWLLQQLDWRSEEAVPTVAEAMVYKANLRYVRYLIEQTGDRSGSPMEALCEYLLSCMPGCKTTRRRRRHSTEYDIICSMEGFEIDFRSEFGRYFVCECKDWSSAADFTVMAKFCRVLDSMKSRFGILFSKKGITGAGKSDYAEREQLKVFQDRGMVIIVIDESDLEKIAAGANFIAMLREKYELVRLDLFPR